MADKFTRSPKKPFNPLLNVSVTGATLEDFTQNAILCPAAEPIPAPVLQAVPLNNQPEPESSANDLVDISQQLSTDQSFHQQELQQPATYQFDTYNQQYGSFSDNQATYNPSFPPPVAGTSAGADSNTSTLSASVLSSFSNILSFGGQPRKENIVEEVTIPNPNSVEHLLNSSAGSESSSNFVPFYSTSTHGDSFALSGPSPGLSGPELSSSGISGPGISTSVLTAPTFPTSGIHTSAFPTPGTSTPGLTAPRIPSPGLTTPRIPSPGLSGPISGLPSTSGIFTPVVPPFGISAPGIPTSGISAPVLPTPGLSASGLSAPVLAAPIPISELSAPGTSSGLSGPGIPAPTVSASGVPPAATGPGNTYRRQGQKKAAYAPIPGFSSTPSQSIPQPHPDLNLSFPAPAFETSTTQLHPQSQSLPSLFTPSPVSYTSTPVSDTKPSNLLIPSTDFSEVQSLDGTSSAFLTPVMSDVQSSTNSPATLNSSTTLHTLRSSSPIAATDMAPPKTAPIMNSAPYRPVYHHWFHRKEIEGRVIWQPFSMVDSLALESAFVSTDISPEYMVATDGGRYDVNILRRQRNAVYWEGTPTEVRRCSWFYKTTNDGRFTPYEENVATKLEEEYKAAYEVNQWHRKVDLANGETVVFHAPDVLVLFPQSSAADVWNQTPQSALRPRVVKRGMDEFDIDEGEPTKIDHLLFLVHGIGSVCDLKFRSVEEVVDDFRSISLQLVQSHYKSSCDQGIANRIEVLPVSWHNQLHSEDTGIDRKLKSITLESIPRLRDFTNDTLLDILFYTSPIYSQTIISTVGNELNRIHTLFKQRNPGFKGSVSVGGHSLGSLILFDILCHQHPAEKEDELNPDVDGDIVHPMNKLEKPHPSHRRMSRRISYMMGAVGTGQPQMSYPHLNFHPISFFALGSPIGMFVTVRGLESLGEQFALPTCPGFFNIFHPYDPVAYRIESLINPELSDARPVLIPHHKGRKRMHLELKETMARVGADLKQRVVDSVKSTWNSVYQLAMFHRSDNRALEAEVDKVLKEQIANEESERMRTESTSEEDGQTDLPVGILNNGRRIDYVLQEAPFEFFNEYIFALTSHVCYWESEDTMLLILKEIYSSMGISVDSQIPQQTMTIERSSPSPVPDAGPRSLQMANPLRPMVYNPNQGPPPTAGFIRKT